MQRYNEASKNTEVCIGLGSNINPERHIENALEHLSRDCLLIAVSTFYRTKAIDRPEQPDYLNGVVLIRTQYTPRELKHSVLSPIETLEGRKRSQDRYAARTLDMDILLFGELIVEEAGLIIPDPDIQERRFLQAALRELSTHINSKDMVQLLNAQLNSATEQQYLQPDESYTRKMHERFCP